MGNMNRFSVINNLKSSRVFLMPQGQHLHKRDRCAPCGLHIIFTENRLQFEKKFYSPNS